MRQNAQIYEFSDIRRYDRKFNEIEAGEIIVLGLY